MAEPEVHVLKQPVSDDDWARGPAGAAVVLVEYGDFDCPDCQNSYPVIERLLDSFRNQVRFIFRQFPMASRHPRAEHAALASEAAGRQGKFWEMYHRLMQARGALAPADLRRYAQELGLDLARFARDLADDELLARIRRVKVSAVRSGANGTPTLFINGLRYDGAPNPVDEVELREAIGKALRERP